MHTEPLTPSSPSPRSPWDALLHSKWACIALIAGGIATASSASRADDFNTFVGAGVGAVAGAMIGQSVGGRNGAIIGAGTGGLVGASIAQHGSYPYPVAAVPVQPMVSAYPSYPSHRYAPAPVYYARPPAVVYQAPVYRVESWSPPRHRDHGHQYGWDQRREYYRYAPAPRHERPSFDGRGDHERMRGEHRDWRN